MGINGSGGKEDAAVTAKRASAEDATGTEAVKGKFFFRGRQFSDRVHID